VITAAWSPHAAYWINAVSFLVSALLVARIPARMLQSAVALTRGHWTDLKDGFAVVLGSRPLLAVLFAWGIATIGSGAVNVSEIFLAQNTLHAGDWGYGLLYGAIGTGLVVGSLSSAALVERLGIARAYGASLALMALAFGVGAASPNIWMAGVCCLVGGIGDGGAVVCNALLVQRATRDEMRGRALTFVMSLTWATTGIGIVLAGALMGVNDARWVWLSSALVFVVAAGVGYALAREPAGQPAPVQAPAN
jgi:dTMP kinase